MKRYMLLMFLVFVVASLTASKGPMDKIIITAPNGKTLEVTDPSLTESLSMAALEIFPTAINEPKDIGNGYVLQRQFKDANLYHTFDVVLYYPDGDHGYVFYGGIVNGWSEYDGKWFEASETGVEAMNRIIRQIKLRTSTTQLSILR